MKSQPFIRVQGLVKEYRALVAPAALGGEVVALKGIDLEIMPGEFLVVTGKSGAGKTTLVNMLAGLDRVTAGEIWVQDTPVHTLGLEKAAHWRGRTMGVVFQSFELLPTLTVLQNVMLPMDFAGRYGGVRGRHKRRDRALYLLEQVGIAEHAGKPPTAVSGGQQQRVAIARALANDPTIVVADEPTGSLDSATTAAVLGVFEALAAEGKTVVLVTHDKDVAARGTRVITLSDGEIV